MPELKDVSVLIVDDDSAFREAMEYAFKKAGYKVLSAGTGKEAFALLQAGSVDVVISDIRMPEWDGVALMDQTKAINPGVPIILLVTGMADISTDEAYSKGAEALFSKPLDRKILLKTVSRLVMPREDRWSDPIASADMELKIELQFPDLDRAVEARAVNLGRGGMFVGLHQDFPNINDTVTFRIVFNQQAFSLDGNGIVRWIRVKDSLDFPAGCGIEYTHLRDQCRDKLIELVDAQKPRAFIPNR